MDNCPDDQVRVNDTNGESPGVTTRSTSVAAYLDFSDLIYQCRAISPCDDESKSRDELLEEVLTLRQQLQKLCDAFDMQAASIRTANAHCTIVKRALEDCRTQLQNNTKKKSEDRQRIKHDILPGQVYERHLILKVLNANDVRRRLRKRKHRRLLKQMLEIHHHRGCCIKSVRSGPLILH